MAWVPVITCIVGSGPRRVWGFLRVLFLFVCDMAVVVGFRADLDAGGVFVGQRKGLECQGCGR